MPILKTPISIAFEAINLNLKRLRVTPDLEKILRLKMLNPSPKKQSQLPSSPYWLKLLTKIAGIKRKTNVTKAEIVFIIITIIEGRKTLSRL